MLLKIYDFIFKLNHYAYLLNYLPNFFKLKYELKIILKLINS